MSKQRSNFTIEELEHALKLCARVIVLHGEIYLPIFERLEREIRIAQNKKDAYQRAIDIIKRTSDIKS